DPRVGGAGEEGRDDLFPEGEQGADAGGSGRDVITAGAAGFADEVLATELAEVVRGVAAGIAGLSGHVADLDGEVGSSEGKISPAGWRLPPARRGPARGG